MSGLSGEAIRAIADVIDAEPDEADKEALRLALARSLMPGPIERQRGRA